MSDEYVVRRVDDEMIMVWSSIYTSADEALGDIADVVNRDARFTVHKLGPAIEPPEPREWVVVDGLGYAHVLSTRKQATGRAEELNGGDGCHQPYRVARVVFEDPS